MPRAAVCLFSSLLLCGPALADASPPPDQGAPAAVAEPDRDHDGVPDRIDRCPDEPEAKSGLPPGDGCPDGGRIWPRNDMPATVPQVYFRSGARAPAPTTFPILDELALLIRHHPEIRRVEVVGHTDGRERAKGLGLARAESVAAALRARGVDAARLTTRDAGRALPASTDRNAAARDKNRRVELRVLESR